MDGAESVESGDEPSDEVESSDEPVGFSDEPVVSSDELVWFPVDALLTCAVVVFGLPIDPSQAITPQASTNVASTEAATRRRMSEIRRSRAASRSRPTAARSEGG
jgi:hypothetical protein